MADFKDMTPEELRALAAALEAKTEALEPNRRRVTVDGITLDVDVHVISDIRTLRLVRDIQRTGDDAVFAALDLFDLLLGDQRDRVEKALEDADGHVDAERYIEFCGRVFEAVGAKN